MNRCESGLPVPPTAALPRRALLGTWLQGAILLCGISATIGANGQSFKRPFPPGALRGTMVVISPTELTINGTPERLSPGARIRSAQNLLVMSGAIIGQELVVNYTRENQGLIHEVWILTPEEAREKRATKPASSS